MKKLLWVTLFLTIDLILIGSFVRVSDADSDVLARLQGIGVRPGAVVRVRTQPPRYVGAAGEALGLTPAEAETIRVRSVLS